MKSEQIGAHHCTPESIAALLADLDAIGECREVPPLQDRDHRAMAGVAACVIRHLQQVGKRLIVDKANLMAERNELRTSAEPPAPHISEPFTISEWQVERICTAYESGYGRGQSKRDLSQPYATGCPDALAYYKGWLLGIASNAQRTTDV